MRPSKGKDATEKPAARPRSVASTALRDKNRRVLIVSHSHPKLSRGGAEIAAYQHYQELKSRPGVDAYFLACSPESFKSPDGAVFRQPFSEHEFQYSPARFDHFLHGNRDAEFYPEFDDLLAELDPDILHFHHYSRIGLETFFRSKRKSAKTPVVLTLHEFLAICNAHGQMVKPDSFSLCHEPTPRDCAQCFPQYSAQDFFLRELYIKRFLDQVDAFISPSRFLADRYVAWGLPAAKMHIVENGMPDSREALPDPPDTRRGTLKLGFFGQISILKGIDVVIEAARLLDADRPGAVSIEIYGDDQGQPLALRTRHRKGSETIPASCVFMGAYDNRQVVGLMRAVDAVLVPSIWWENSPLVIQEAKKARRPIVTSNIGGMAEKVVDGVDGLHFQVGSPVALARAIGRLIDEPELLTGLRRGIGRPADLADSVSAICDIYDRLSSS